MKSLARIAILLWACAALLSADTITLSGALSGTADFVFGTNQVTITLTNTTVAKDAGTLLTDLYFQLTNGPTSTTVPTLDVSAKQSQPNGSGELIDINSDGSYSVVGTTGGWGFGTYNGAYLLCTICSNNINAPYNPAEGIVGPGPKEGTATPYKGVNASITYPNPHDPLFRETATFILQGDNIGLNTHVQNVYFSFGTTFGTEYPGTGGGITPGGGEVPEPMTFVLTGTALLGVGIFSKRRRDGRSKQ